MPFASVLLIRTRGKNGVFTIGALATSAPLLTGTAAGIYRCAMWTAIVILWSLPLALWFLMLTRVAQGSPALSDEEIRFLFGDREEIILSPWMVLKFSAFALLSFIVGVVESVFLFNAGSVWLVIVPLITGLGAMLLLAHWLRSAPRGSKTPRRKTVQSYARESRTAGGPFHDRPPISHGYNRAVLESLSWSSYCCRATKTILTSMLQCVDHLVKIHSHKGGNYGDRKNQKER